jgi:hypothetical protein
MTNTGKIGRLPHEIRDQLNRRLLSGEPGKRLVTWLNSLPETQRVLAACFDSRPINEPNLTAWKAGGYQEWLVKEETFAEARELGSDAREIAAATDGPDGRLTDHLAAIVASRYAVFLRHWNGEATDDIRRKSRVLHGLCHHVLQLQRRDHDLAALDLGRNRSKSPPGS